MRLVKRLPESSQWYSILSCQFYDLTWLNSKFLVLDC